MEKDPYLNRPAGELLMLFGKGSHKPGSGSAVAFQGMLAAQMIRTVVDLSLKKGKYVCKKSDLEFIISEIDDQIYLELEKLLQFDAEQFHKVIQARTNRDNVTDILLKRKFADEAIDELKKATNIPVVIAKHCIRLAEFALFIFDNAFQSVRGDSSVAINGAISAIAGSISIINLNLLTIPNDTWCEEIRLETEILKNERDRLLLSEDEKQISLRQEADRIHNFKSAVSELQKKNQPFEGLTDGRLEKYVIDLQNLLWEHRDAIWKQSPNNPIEMLSPSQILKKLDYIYKEEETLGTYDITGESFEVAGLIDTSRKFVSISQNFSTEVKNFTIAHELGHALMHPNQVLHRDRPLDGSFYDTFRSGTEKQADKFAAFFLMPRKQVIKYFKEKFLVDKFILGPETALRLGVKLKDIRDEIPDENSLASFVASLEFYNSKHFVSLANFFSVTENTMAIRLKELKLISLK